MLNNFKNKPKIILNQVVGYRKMIIREMFDKPINRKINGVIKVGQKDEESIYQELSEYVVTKQLLKHFQKQAFD